MIPESERIVTIEQTAELHLDRPDLVSLEARSTGGPGQLPVTLREILRSGLRMRPDRLLVGEVRGSETLDLLQAMSAGHPGSMLTVNAISTRDALERIELLTATGDARPSCGTLSPDRVGLSAPDPRRPLALRRTQGRASLGTLRILRRQLRD